MKRSLAVIFSFLLPWLAPFTGNHASAPQKHDTVILLHGIGQNSLHMKGVEYALKKEGYDVINIKYPSLKKDITALTDVLHDHLLQKEIWAKQGQIHFVTNSMGGLVTRYYLDRYKNDIPADKLGRIVMLAPPNRGSEIADLFQNCKTYHFVYGPAGRELTTTVQRENMHTPYYDLGVVAGSKGKYYPVANLFFPGGAKAHDGRVTITNTLIPGVKDHLVVDATHSFMAWRKDVHKQIITFIQNGTFTHAA